MISFVRNGILATANLVLQTVFVLVVIVPVLSSEKIHVTNAYCLVCCNNFWGFNPFFADALSFLF